MTAYFASKNHRNERNETGWPWQNRDHTLSWFTTDHPRPRPQARFLSALGVLGGNRE
jgi:hypothetical protein